MLLCLAVSSWANVGVVGQMMMGGAGNKITPEIVCHACGAVLKEVEKVLKLKAGSRRSESDVMDAVAGICVSESFKIYDYPPPKMIKACQKVMDDHDEDVEQAFLRKPKLTVADIEEIVCKKPCKGVDRTAPPSTMSSSNSPAQPDVYMDGVPIQTSTQAAPPSPKKKKKKKKGKGKGKKKGKKKKKKKKKKGKKKKDEL
jgi:hypothetical protein